jgi:hypothetical protein
MTKPITTFQLVPVWPPMFEARLPALLRASTEEANRSAAASARRRILLDSEDEADRRRGARTMFGLSRSGDERITKERS